MRRMRCWILGRRSAVTRTLDNWRSGQSLYLCLESAPGGRRVGTAPSDGAAGGRAPGTRSGSSEAVGPAARADQLAETRLKLQAIL